MIFLETVLKARMTPWLMWRSLAKASICKHHRCLDFLLSKCFRQISEKKGPYFNAKSCWTQKAIKQIENKSLIQVSCGIIVVEVGDATIFQHGSEIKVLKGRMTGPTHLRPTFILCRLHAKKRQLEVHSNFNFLALDGVKVEIFLV